MYNTAQLDIPFNSAKNVLQNVKQMYFLILNKILVSI